MKNYIPLLGLAFIGIYAADIPVNPIKKIRIKCYKQAYVHNNPQRYDSLGQWYNFINGLNHPDNFYYVDIAMNPQMSLWDLQEELLQKVGPGRLRFAENILDPELLITNTINDMLAPSGNGRFNNDFNFWPLEISE